MEKADRNKCNIDASFSSSLNKFGLGMFIRNDVDEFERAKMDQFAPLFDVDVGEAVGLHTTLQWVSDLQFDNADFALDFKRVVDHVNFDEDDNSELVVKFLLVDDCYKIDLRTFMSSSIEDM